MGGVASRDDKIGSGGGSMRVMIVGAGAIAYRHAAAARDLHGADLVVSYLGSIVSWPVLLFADVCMT